MAERSPKVFFPRYVVGVSVLDMIDFGSHMEKVSRVEGTSVHSVRRVDDQHVCINKRLMDGDGLEVGMGISDMVGKNDDGYAPLSAFIVGGVC